MSFYKKFFGIMIVVFCVLAFLRGIILLDPDFGWHIRNGEMIETSGLVYKDPFSYTEVNYPVVYHEWSLDLLFVKLYPIIGMSGLASIFVVILGFTFLVLDKMFKFNRGFVFLYGPLFFASSAGFFAVRPQVFSWFFMALLVCVCFNKLLWEKYRGFLPIGFLIWANVHGSVAAGIVFFSIMVFGKIIRTRKIEVSNLLLVGVCSLVTLINPYGIGLWREIWSSVSDGSLRWTISEWMPVFMRFDPAFLFYVTISMFLLYRYRNKFLVEWKLSYVFFLVQAVLSQRNLPLWLVISLPILDRSLGYMYKEVSKYKFGLERGRKMYRGCLVLVMVLVVLNYSFSFRDAFYVNEKSFYPKKAISYLRGQNLSGQIFAEYGFGGYLDWKLPEKKVFIDGRMPSWSGGIMEEYQEIIGGKSDFASLAQKYNIEWVMISTAYDHRKFSQQLISLKWKEVYRDRVAVVYNGPYEDKTK